MKPVLKVVFMGTPAFSVAMLDALVESRHEVVGVVTAPDKPSGRGLKMQGSAVKQRAEALQIPLAQPEKLKDPLFHHWLDQLQADVYVVVAFRMLPEVVWKKPRLGTLNLHASLLPDLRGAAPIQWAILYGYPKTGLTTFLIDHAIDTGQLLLQKEMDILPEETFGSLHDRMMQPGGDLVVETLDRLSEGTIHPVAQQITGFERHAPKIFRKDTEIHWHLNGEEILRKLRGFYPYPGSFFVWNQKIIKIHSGRWFPLKKGSEKVEIGTMIVLPEQGLSIRCGDGWICPLTLQPEGKKEMDAQAFAAGYLSKGGNFEG